MRSWLFYTAARLGLFVAAFGLVQLLGVGSLWLALILAWVISGLASYVLLSKWRDQLSTQIVDHNEKRKGSRLADRLEGGAFREDDLQEKDQEPEADTGSDAEGRSTDETPAKET